MREVFGGCFLPPVTLHVCQPTAQQQCCSRVPTKDASVSLEFVLIVPLVSVARRALLASSI